MTYSSYVVSELARLLVGMLGLGQCLSLPEGHSVVLVWEDVVQGTNQL